MGSGPVGDKVSKEIGRASEPADRTSELAGMGTEPTKRGFEPARRGLEPGGRGLETAGMGHSPLWAAAHKKRKFSDVEQCFICLTALYEEKTAQGQ